MIKLSTIAAVAALSLGVAGTANAIPMLEITGAVGGNTGGPSTVPITLPIDPPVNGVNPGWAPGGAPDAGNQEAIGDPGGTNISNGPTAGASPGPGMPTVDGTWPNNPATMAPDTYGAGGNGITGYDASYLNLTEATNVTFQFMGKGDATDHDQFWAYVNNTWTMLWDNQSQTNGTCGVSGTSPICPFDGSQQTYYFDAGLIPFFFVNLSNPALALNDGQHNPSPDFVAGTPTDAGYFLGMDPYLTGSPYDTSGKATYIGFTDRGCDGTPGGTCDHDYEDLIVRASVPEPGTIFLLGAGLLGFGVGRRKMAARSV